MIFLPLKLLKAAELEDIFFIYFLFMNRFLVTPAIVFLDDRRIGIRTDPDLVRGLFTVRSRVREVVKDLAGIVARPASLYFRRARDCDGSPHNLW